MTIPPRLALWILVLALCCALPLAAQSPAPKDADPEDLLSDPASPAPSPKPSPAVVSGASPSPAAKDADPDDLLGGDAPPSPAPSAKPSPAPSAASAKDADPDDLLGGDAPASPAPSPAVAASAKPSPAPSPAVAAEAKPSPSPSAAAAKDSDPDDLLGGDAPASPAPSPAIAASAKPSPAPSAAAAKDSDPDDLLGGDAPASPAPSPAIAASAKPSPAPSPAIAASPGPPPPSGKELEDDLMSGLETPPSPKPAGSAAAGGDAIGDIDLFDGPPPSPGPSVGSDPLVVEEALSLDGKPGELTEAPPPSSDKVHVNSIGMRFVWLPTGSFQMGRSPGDEEAELAESPARAVTISRVLGFGMHEVTQSDMRKVLGRDNSRFPGPDRPTDAVTWDEARAFCTRLSLVEGRRYRLPTEAEWEYACRAGTTTARYSKRPLVDLAWYRVNSSRITQPVGKKPPNAWGLHDMLGNVAEWCEDVWHESYRGAPSDGSPWLARPFSLLEALGVPLRVRRGGGANNYAAFCRSSHRSWAAQSTRPSDCMGFRVVLEK